ncbi:hypothetical protein KSF78_0006019 [Schistosoma japonicum]|nr:hypothetical protein KSF78_0006019 [Schistosoma japonicum]
MLFTLKVEETQLCLYKHYKTIKKNTFDLGNFQRKVGGNEDNKNKNTRHLQIKKCDGLVGGVAYAAKPFVVTAFGVLIDCLDKRLTMLICSAYCVIVNLTQTCDNGESSCKKLFSTGKFN